MYVIMRKDGLFVALPGSDKSYTSRLQDAWTFRTMYEANVNVCPDNETTVSVASIMERNCTEKQPRFN